MIEVMRAAIPAKYNDSSELIVEVSPDSENTNVYSFGSRKRGER